jgi:hypothetical protein
MKSVANVDTYTNSWMKVVMLVLVATQKNRMFMVMNSVVKMNTNMRNFMNVVMMAR